MKPNKLRKPGPFRINGQIRAYIMMNNSIRTLLDFWPHYVAKEFGKWLTRANAWIEQQEKRK
jgi:hypothetical protein